MAQAGKGRKRRRNQLITCHFVHPNIFGVIALAFCEMRQKLKLCVTRSRSFFLSLTSDKYFTGFSAFCNRHDVVFLLPISRFVASSWSGITRNKPPYKRFDSWNKTYRAKLQCKVHHFGRQCSIRTNLVPRSLVDEAGKKSGWIRGQLRILPQLFFLMLMAKPMQ